MTPEEILLCELGRAYVAFFDHLDAHNHEAASPYADKVQMLLREVRELRRNRKP